MLYDMTFRFFESGHNLMTKFFVLRFQQFLEFLIRVMQVLVLLYVFNVDNTKYKVCFMEFRRHNEY